MRPAAAELACAIVNEPLATAETYMVPLPTSVAAFAVTGVNSGTDPVAQPLPVAQLIELWMVRVNGII